METSKTGSENFHSKANIVAAERSTLIERLWNILGEYMTADEIRHIHSAYVFGANAHLDQTRVSGEPYIDHPVQVAHIMAELRLDAVTIAAGLLHDVLEDTDITKKQLSKKFGNAVAEVVDGVSKLPKLKFKSAEIGQAKNFQKMLLAMAKDLRVILVKLSDRLHNMRTIHHLPTTNKRK